MALYRWGSLALGLHEAVWHAYRGRTSLWGGARDINCDLDYRLMLANLKVAISMGWDHGEFGGNDLLKPVLKIWPLCNRGSNAA